MKKLMIGFAMVLSLALVANVTLSDETVPFPYWQHGWALFSFWSVTNTNATTPVTVTIQLLTADGSLHHSTTSSIQPNNAWLLASYDPWYQDPGVGDNYGYGKYIIDTPDETAQFDCIYLWGAVLADKGDFQPGYTVILPKNPYGIVGM